MGKYKQIAKHYYFPLSFAVQGQTEDQPYTVDLTCLDTEHSIC